MNKQDCHIQGKIVPDQLLDELKETRFPTEDVAELQRRLVEDGYLFLRSLIDADDVMAARREVFARLADVGEIEQPAWKGIATGTSHRAELCDDLGEYWKSVSEGPSLRNVIHGRQTAGAMTAVFGETARPHDFVFLRPGVSGRATSLHFDQPFFARGSKRIHTVWTALREIPVCDGPLVIVEGSHRFTDLIEKYLEVDYESNDSPQVTIAEAVDLVRRRSVRLLTADFDPGDVVIFGMTTLHGAMDNHSDCGRTRLSCDVRWQPATHPIDPRYCGPDPGGTTGAGYGELNGAKPLDQLWHTR